MLPLLKLDSIPGQGTKIPQATWCRQKQQNKESIKITNWVENSNNYDNDMHSVIITLKIEITNSTSENENTDFSLLLNLFNFSKTSFVILITNLNVISFTVLMAFTL